jgi:hypothetical protein
MKEAAVEEAVGLGAEEVGGAVAFLMAPESRPLAARFLWDQCPIRWTAWPLRWPVLWNLLLPIKPGPAPSLLRLMHYESPRHLSRMDIAFKK